MLYIIVKYRVAKNVIMGLLVGRNLAALTNDNYYSRGIIIVVGQMVIMIRCNDRYPRPSNKI